MPSNILIDIGLWVVIGGFLVAIVIAIVRDVIAQTRNARFTYQGHSFDWYDIDPVTSLPRLPDTWKWTLRPADDDDKSIFSLVNEEQEEFFTQTLRFSKGDTDKYIARTLEESARNILFEFKKFLATPNIDKFYGAYPPKNIKTPEA